MLGGCGILIAALVASTLWRRRDMSVSWYRTGNGLVAGFLFAWIAGSVLMMLLILATG